MTIPAEIFIEQAVAKKMKFQGNNQQAILRFLQERKDEAFTQNEIQEKLGITYAPSVNATLHSLRLRGLITGKTVGGKNYWCAKDVPETDDISGSNTENG